MQPHLSSSSLISAPLPELCFGRAGWFTELLAFPLALKKKKERHSPYMHRGREKPLHQVPRAHAHPRPIWTHSLLRPTQTHKKLHACQQCNWKNWATWHLKGTLSDMQVITLMIVPTYSPPHLWGFCSMYSTSSAFLLPKPPLTRAYASAANLHSEISSLFLCICF